MPGVSIPGHGVHNVVYVATEHDSVFAFDADGTSITPLWKTSFIDPAAGVTTVPSSDLNCGDLVPEVGITGTPVIDPTTGALYVIAKTKESGSYVQRLHALDIRTGQEKFGGSVTIEPIVAGMGEESVNGEVSFDAKQQMNRAALLLADGVIYAGFGSHCDHQPYHGWLVGYDSQTLAQVAVFNTTPDGAQGAIWGSGNGPAADSSGDVFAATGNGSFDADTSVADYGENFLKLAPGTLMPQDYFAPYDANSLNGQDLDLGSSGTILLPDQLGTIPHLMVGAGRDGTIYPVNRDDLGRFDPSGNSQIVQSIPGALGEAHGTPAFFNDTVYYAASFDVLKAFTLQNGLFSTSPAATGNVNFNYPGASPAVSASGTANGIVWVVGVFSGQPTTPANFTPTRHPTSQPSFTTARKCLGAIGPAKGSSSSHPRSQTAASTSARKPKSPSTACWPGTGEFTSLRGRPAHPGHSAFAADTTRNRLGAPARGRRARRAADLLVYFLSLNRSMASSITRAASSGPSQRCTLTHLPRSSSL